MKLPVKYSTLVWDQIKEIKEEYVKIQNGNCWYCNHPLDKPPPKSITKNPIDLTLYPPGFLTYPIHLQHDHNTDWTEGAVHGYCNCVLWEYEKK